MIEKAIVNIGQKVRSKYSSMSPYNPPKGTIGIVKEVVKQHDHLVAKVQWPRGTTVGEDLWWITLDELEGV